MNFQKFCAEILPHITCEGKPIEDFEDDYDNLEYFDTGFCCWRKADDALYNLDVLRLELRITLKPEYRPFTLEDEEIFFGKKVYDKLSKEPFMIIDCDVDGVFLPRGSNAIYRTYEDLLEFYIFPNNEPCGVEL
jgi:hypothetical protein